MYKLVAIDLDGTLLDTGKSISAENRKAIASAVEKGVKVVICSGRVFSGARVFAREIGLKSGPLIGCNGALIKELHTQELLYSKTLKPEDCIKVIELCQREGLYFHAYAGDTLYTEQLEYSSRNYWLKNQSLPPEERLDIKVVNNMAYTFSEEDIPVLKFVIVSRNREKLGDVRSKLSELPSLRVMSSGWDNLEVVDRSVDKGSALKFIAETMNIAREEVMAIGDNENDLEMLEYAGMAVAMGNGIPSVFEVADHITGKNDDHGVSQAINKFILGW